jgi:uncharacterized protein (UPF0332 family)
MTDEVSGGVARARRELAAARLLADNGFGAQAVSRSYYAAFYAAEAALLSIRETRSKHSGVIAAVGALLVRQRGLDEQVRAAQSRAGGPQPLRWPQDRRGRN